MVTRLHKRPRAARRGLSLPEAMISLAITATLLLAVATAFAASTKAIQANDSFFRCSQASRVAMNQMLGEIRNCDTMALDQTTPPNTTWMKVMRPAPVNGVTNQMYVLATNAGGSQETYRMFNYNSASKTITLQITYADGTTSPNYELASNVSNCQFGPADWGTDYTGYAIPIRVPITITVSTGGNSIVLNGAAGPRRAINY